MMSPPAYVRELRNRRLGGVIDGVGQRRRKSGDTRRARGRPRSEPRRRRGDRRLRTLGHQDFPATGARPRTRSGTPSRVSRNNCVNRSCGSPAHRKKPPHWQSSARTASSVASSEAGTLTGAALSHGRQGNATRPTSRAANVGDPADGGRGAPDRRRPGGRGPGGPRPPGRSDPRWSSTARRGPSPRAGRLTVAVVE